MTISESAGLITVPEVAGIGAGARHRESVWILKRLGSGVLVLLAVSVVVFAATQALPSDPAQAMLGRQATPELLDALRQKLGLDQSLPVQYVHWFSGLLHGDLGTSLASQQPVTGVLGPRLLNSLALLAGAALIMIPFSIGAGVFLAARRDRSLDRTVNAGLMAVMALPDFVVGTIFLLVFATTVMPVLPAVSLVPPGASGFSHPRELVLPVLTAVTITAPFLIRQVRASMIETLESEHIAQARLRGIAEKRIIWRHALPNALVPLVQGSALMLSYLLGGVVVIEYVFNYPGLGGMLNDAVVYRDLPVLQAVSLTFAAGVVAFNLIADLLTIMLTPRLRTSGGAR
ncbi:ABC transporter permease [Aeromicrobium sp. 9AM]|uniref:ABC transporter permease n=1 Tax=Aeromicrobium sp. 9AM TaxID=2653126 RepID=UPI0012F3DCFF|nr:ABC transporter permease [Aeromicrobium sp. 9AM]VXB62903.1 Dipeptide/oligopeptide ABC transporter permease protein [Aeromicrobium sp. 9AM]